MPKTLLKYLIVPYTPTLPDMIGIRLLQMLPTMGEKGAKDFRNSYLTCHMLPEEVESCDFETLKIEIGHRHPNR